MGFMPDTKNRLHTACGRKWVTVIAAAYKTYGRGRQQIAHFSTQKTINIVSNLCRKIFSGYYTERNLREMYAYSLKKIYIQ